MPLLRLSRRSSLVVFSTNAELLMTSQMAGNVDFDHAFLVVEATPGSRGTSLATSRAQEAGRHGLRGQHAGLGKEGRRGRARGVQERVRQGERGHERAGLPPQLHSKRHIRAGGETHLHLRQQRHDVNKNKRNGQLHIKKKNLR